MMNSSKESEQQILNKGILNALSCYFYGVLGWVFGKGSKRQELYMQGISNENMREFDPVYQGQEEEKYEFECEVASLNMQSRRKSYSGEEFEYRLERMTTKSARELVRRGSNQQLKTAVNQMHNNTKSMHKAIVVLNQLSVELDIHQAMRNIQATATQLLQCERVTLFLMDPENEELRAYLAEGDLISLGYGEGVAGTVASTGKGLNIKDAYKCNLFSQRIDKVTGFRTKAILCVPIIDARPKIVAVLQAVNKVGGDSFTSEDEANVLLLGRHLGNTVTKSKMFETIRTEKQRLALLSTSHQILSRVKDLSEFISQSLQVVHQLVRGEIASLFLVDQAANEVWSASRSTFGRDIEFEEEKASLHPTSNVFKKPVSRYSLSEDGILSRVAKGEGSVVISGDDWQNDKQLADVVIDLCSYQLEEVRVRSILVQAVSSSVKEKVLAVIVVINRVIVPEDILFNACFRNDERNAMQVLASQCGDYLCRNTLDVAFASALSTVSGEIQEAFHSELDLLYGQLEYYTTGRRTSQPLSSMFQQIRSRSSTTASSSYECNSPTTNVIQSFNDLRTWDLDLVSFNTTDLVPLVYDMLANLNVKHILQTETKTIFNFVRSALQVYNDVPYHNACHATYVVHSVYMIILDCGLVDFLKDMEVVALLIAALAHDLDHNGFTNQFHVLTGSQWALMYNDQSVLENHHCAMLFGLLENPDNNIFANLTTAQIRVIRAIIIQLILSTDMSQHASLMSDMKSLDSVSGNMEEKDRLVLMQAVLHAADISNSARPMPICFEMGNRIHGEFALQVQKEEELGLPSVPHMKATSPAMQYKLEMSFNSYIVLPYWQQMAEICPQLQPRVQQIIRNNSKYQELFLEAQQQQEEQQQLANGD